ncbi:vWA domain-containing protein [Pedobacter caeni]|uniref:Ca-activated chloride channel family protein n=1 Tax=Pedobacter caeni TaxID=288992 RepID=A0A1M5D6M6_9SPHI|nr:VWA domain-containing protein [Pedobacter caeni]SHF62515.1 Ca-activated chloride channel family protein [Pedobacter caeni]
MKKLLLPIFVVLFLFGFKATTVKTIQGIVIDKSDGLPLPGVQVSISKTKKRTTTDPQGKYTIVLNDNEQELQFSYIGYKTQTIKVGNKTLINISMEADNQTLNEVVVTGYQIQAKKSITSSVATIRSYSPTPAYGNMVVMSPPASDTESYANIQENVFHNPDKTPLSTFSIDVDAASYSNVRRYLNNGGLPPKDAVRIEEMINYFDYDYPQPTGNDPVNIITEISTAPWNNKHKLVQIGLQGKSMKTDQLPASNLVFLIDVSGSMAQPNKLPLLVSSFKLLTNQLREKDKVAIVVYAGNSGLVLPSTPGNMKTTIKEALNKLTAGGSTAGGQGIELAYKVAGQHFIKGGNNRVILATDGDFNVGASSDKEMEQLIEEKRKSGVFLTVLGYGMGNTKDSKMETLADKGNGNYAYIDNITEARKVLVNEFGGTLFTIAKDVKLQVEFNPAKVQAYRLIGYENRLLEDKDFNDDRKDAGDLGSGHTVTALYEIIPTGVQSSFTPSVDPLKYQENKKNNSSNGSPEMLTVKLRYKEPDGNHSKLLQKSVIDASNLFEGSSNNFRFAAAVAEFGMLLRQSDFKQKSSYGHVISLVEQSMGKDKEGYRSEFLKLVKSSQLLAKDLLTIEDTKDHNEKN